MINKYCLLWIVLYLQDIVSAAASLSRGGDLPLIHKAAERIKDNLGFENPETLLSTPPTNVGVSSTLEEKMNFLFRKLTEKAKESMRNQLAPIVDGYSFRFDDKADRGSRYRIHFVLGLFEFIARYQDDSTKLDGVIALSKAYPEHPRFTSSSFDYKKDIESLIETIVGSETFRKFDAAKKSILLRYISATAWFANQDTKLKMLKVISEIGVSVDPCTSDLDMVAFERFLVEDLNDAGILAKIEELKKSLLTARTFCADLPFLFAKEACVQPFRRLVFESARKKDLAPIRTVERIDFLGAPSDSRKYYFQIMCNGMEREPKREKHTHEVLDLLKSDLESILDPQLKLKDAVAKKQGFVESLETRISRLSTAAPAK